MTENNYDIIIIGGGIVGSSTAFYLAGLDKNLKIAVIERDPAYTKASTTLSAANIRVQFGLKENILTSIYTIGLLERFSDVMEVDGEKPDVSYKKEGNLFLIDKKQKDAALKCLDLQKELGGSVEWLIPEQIKEMCPLYELEDIEGGTFGAKDGHFDAYAFLMGFKRCALAIGVKYIKDEAVEICTDRSKILGVRLESGENLKSGYVVNCAGAWASEIAATAGVKLPIEPVKRQCFIVEPKEKLEKPLPFTILPSGLYFRTETGGTVLIGKSIEEDETGFDFNWSRKRFNDELWLELAEIVPAFESLKFIRGWAGLYAVNRLDSNAVIGKWPEMQGLYLINGFSGHGLQQGPAAARYAAELIVGKTPSIDLSVFDPVRILEKRPLNEIGIV